MFGIELDPESMIGFDCTNSAEQVKVLFKDKQNFSFKEYCKNF